MYMQLHYKYNLTFLLQIIRNKNFVNHQADFISNYKPKFNYMEQQLYLIVFERNFLWTGLLRWPKMRLCTPLFHIWIVFSVLQLLRWKNFNCYEPPACLLLVNIKKCFHQMFQNLLMLLMVHFLKTKFLTYLVGYFKNTTGVPFHQGYF